MKRKMTKPERIAHEEKYIAFLEKRLKSESYKKNVSAEEYAKTKEKYEKAKFLLKTLKIER